MSLVHIRLNQISNNDEIVTYKVESTDFSEERAWEELGMLRISKVKNNYEFINSPLAKSNKLIPPELYALPEEERQRELKYKYMNYGSGAWSMCIHYWAKSLISNNSYPKKYPT